MNLQNKEFNISRYLELVAENKQASWEWIELIADVQSQLYYTKKNLYCSLLQNYVTGRIDPDQFRLEFFDLREQNYKELSKLLDDLEKLSRFSISAKAIEFSSLLVDVYNCSMLIIEEEDFSEAEFRDSIEQIFKELKQYCNP